MKIVDNPNMKTIMDKKLVVGADIAGYPLKKAICKHLRAKGWEIEDLGVNNEDDNTPRNMFHRVGLRVGAKIATGEYERALIFCGTGMGIHIAASKCPHVHAAVVESVAAGLRCITGNNCNVLAMGGFYVAPQMGIEIAEAYLASDFGTGYEWWPNFLEFHKLAVDELEAFDFEKFRANGFELEHLYEVDLPDVMNSGNPAFKA